MDEKTLAYINLFAVLGGLSKLCELDEDCRKLIRSGREKGKRFLPCVSSVP